jgi:hypothetical protein
LDVLTGDVGVMVMAAMLGAADVTVRVKLVLVVSSPSLTVSVIVALPV